MSLIPSRETAGTTIVTVSAAITALVCGAVVSEHPIALAAIAALAFASVLVTRGAETQGIFMAALAGLLLGFLLQGRSFAYIGFPPLFISEAVLVLGVVALLLSKIHLRQSLLKILIFCFIFIGLIRTLPFVTTYGAMAVRDAALWYYSLFAILVFGFLTRERLIKFMLVYARLIPPLLAIYIVMPLIGLVIGDRGIRLPGSDVLLPSEIKAGDRAVFLAGISTFVASGVARNFGIRIKFPETLFWLMWFAAVASVMVQNRGGLLALVVSLGLAQVILPTKSTLRSVVLGSFLLTVFFLVNPSISFGGDRSLSPEQLVSNITSIFTDRSSNIGYVQANKEWRLDFWGQIIEDTVGGPKMWGGHGFGLNLAEEYGFLTEQTSQLRSPHNSPITILARMGVPGLAIWTALQLSFACLMVRSFFVAKQHRLKWTPVLVWLLAMWLAALVNACFDVYLEGPQGAIPFWCVFGAGMAVMNWVDDDIRSAKTESDGLIAYTSRS